MRITEARVKTVSDQLISLVPSTSQTTNAFSLANLAAGVYTLDVIAQKGNTRAAYEGILVIGQQPTTVINETTRNIINQEIDLNIRDDRDEECPRGFVGEPPFCERRPICKQNPDAEGCHGLPIAKECPQGYIGKPPFCEPVDCNEHPDAEGCERLAPPLNGNGGDTNDGDGDNEDGDNEDGDRTFDGDGDNGDDGAGDEDQGGDSSDEDQEGGDEQEDNPSEDDQFE